MSLCRRFAYHWLAVTQARASQRLAAQQLMLRKDGRPADYHTRKRRDRLATRARELRAKPPLFSPFGGEPGAKARFPEKVAFERLEKIRRDEAIASKPRTGRVVQGGQTGCLQQVRRLPCLAAAVVCSCMPAFARMVNELAIRLSFADSVDGVAHSTMDAIRAEHLR
jgi:hypothetical protein